MDEKLKEIVAGLAALETKIKEATDGASNAEEAKALLDEFKPELERLQKERDDAEVAATKEGIKALGEQVTTMASTLEAAMQSLRKPAPDFQLPSFSVGSTDEGKAQDDTYANRSFFKDVTLANKGLAEARERLSSGWSNLNEEGKAMTEGTDAQGGYLVRPQIERQLVLARESDNVLRGLCSSINLGTNKIQLDQLGLSTTAGWVAELAQKPEATNMTLASVNANVFTAAGLVTASNQLLADSNPSIDQLVIEDLKKRLVALEETAFLNGTGSGQPYGILQTAGVGTTPLTNTDIPSLLDAVLSAIGAVESAHGAPTAILMHPRTWTAILQSRDAQGAFYIDPQGDVQDPRTGLRGPSKNLWGYPVVLSNRIPTNLGGGTESRIIVGDFREALILDRQGITVDESEHVYFTTNQTVFRVEMRVGFTAGRTPLAFNVIGGAGLAGK